MEERKERKETVEATSGKDEGGAGEKPAGKKAPEGEGGEVFIQELPDERLRRLEEEIAVRTRDAEGNYDKYLRAMADLDNSRKRWEKDKADLVKFANETLIEEMLPVLDNLGRALEHAGAGDENLKSLSEGVRLTIDQMHGVLKKFGLREIHAVGEKFDPSLHHAIGHEDVAGVLPGTVVREFQKGYFLRDKLLRPSLVAVAGGTVEGEKEG